MKKVLLGAAMALLPVVAFAQTIGVYDAPMPPPPSPEYVKPAPECGLGPLGFKPGIFQKFWVWDGQQFLPVEKWTGRCYPV